MRILGIDPGYGRIGYAVLDIGKTNSAIEIVKLGVFETDAATSIEYRLLEIHHFIAGLAREFQVDVAGIEEIFFRKNLTTGINIIQARGVIAMTLASCDVEIFSFSPTALKKLVTGHGQASKIQMKNMVKKLLNIAILPKHDDAADALAVALAVRIKSSFNRQLVSK